MSSRRRAALIAWGACMAASLAVAACGGGTGASSAIGSPSGSAAPSVTPSPIASQAPVPTTAPVPATVAPTAVASASASAGLAGELIDAGRLTICSSFPRPRFAERDAAGKAFGVDIEIGEAIAREMSLEPDVRDLLFDELIDAVETRRCDMSIAGQFITQGRLARIDMIPYREGTQHIVVRAGNPNGLRVLTDLCGRSLAVVTGTIHVDIVRGTGDYAGTGIDDQCRAAGKPAVILHEFPGQREAEDALAAGEVDAYVGNDFVTVDRPQDFELSVALPPTRNGIGVRRGAAALNDGIRTAFRALIADRSYLAILTRYGVEGAQVTVAP